MWDRVECRMLSPTKARRICKVLGEVLSTLLREPHFLLHQFLEERVVHCVEALRQQGKARPLTRNSSKACRNSTFLLSRYQSDHFGASLKTSHC